MQDLNTVTIIGRLTRDPELRALPSGMSVCEFSLAVNGSVKKGEVWEDEANFVNCTLFGAQAESLVKFSQKGDRLAIVGRLKQERWEEANGTKRERIKVIVNTSQFLTPKRDDGDAKPADAPSDAPF